jgi:hypothetical protein
MAGKSKYGNMGENAIAANQNWTDVIEKERTTATQWVSRRLIFMIHSASATLTNILSHS